MIKTFNLIVAPGYRILSLHNKTSTNFKLLSFYCIGHFTNVIITHDEIDDENNLADAFVRFLFLRPSIFHRPPLRHFTHSPLADCLPKEVVSVLNQYIMQNRHKICLPV